MANTNATPQQIQINAQACFGLSQSTNNLVVNYQEPNTTTALFKGIEELSIPANTVNNTINLANYFTAINTALLWGLQDISNPGQQVNIGMASSGTRFSMAPSGFFLIRVNGGSSPILYIDNPSLTTSAILQLIVLAN